MELLFHGALQLIQFSLQRVDCGWLAALGVRTYPTNKEYLPDWLPVTILGTMRRPHVLPLEGAPLCLTRSRDMDHLNVFLGISFHEDNDSLALDVPRENHPSSR
jgi:hypothetical protein